MINIYFKEIIIILDILEPKEPPTRFLLTHMTILYLDTYPKYCDYCTYLESLLPTAVRYGYGSRKINNDPKPKWHH